MHEITDKTNQKLDGISILVGTSSCNANCSFCAGRQHRDKAPKRDGIIDEARLNNVLNYCHDMNCHYITLTGSGEPTLSPKSVSAVLNIIKAFKERGILFNPVNLYTNGIRIGRDEQFCKKYLKLWKLLGLTSIYVSAYSSNKELNAKAFGIKEYPEFETIFRRIKDFGFKLRISVILRKGYTDGKDSLRMLCNMFYGFGADNISVWPLKNEDDSLSDSAPDRKHLLEIRDLIGQYPPGALRVLLGNIEKKQMLGKKIALFQNGEISDIWCAKK